MAELMAKRRRWFWPVMLIGFATLVVLGANAHLVYVAITTQPDCVVHLREKTDRPGEFRAAKSAC